MLWKVGNAYGIGINLFMFFFFSSRRRHTRCLSDWSRRVLFRSDPNAVAGGGAGRLSAAGLEVRSGVLADQVAGGPLREWLHRQRTGLPHVTWKYASSIDGRKIGRASCRETVEVTAADGRWDGRD